MNIRQVACAVAAMGLMAGVALADEAKGKKGAAKGPDMAAMMQAVEKAATPGEQHKMLMKMVGNWDVTTKMWMDPSQPPTETKGTAEVKSILDGRFTQSTFNGSFMGKPFAGVGIDGYDNVKKKFVGAWIDSMGTGICRSEGDEKAGTMTSNMTCTDPMTGKDNVMKMVMKWEGDKKFTEEFIEKKGGKEVKTMEITYTKK